MRLIGLYAFATYKGLSDERHSNDNVDLTPLHAPSTTNNPLRK